MDKMTAGHLNWHVK